MDMILNGQAHGAVAATLLRNGFDVGAMRPYIDEESGQACITQNGEAVPVNNANATLLVREWIQLDQMVVRAALPRLKAVADLRGRGLEYVIPNGMGKTVLQSQAQSDISGASISMDGMGKSKGDRPVYDLRSLPLPIIHKDFSFSAREIATSRNGNMPLDTSMAELAARRVAEGAEQLLLGVTSSYTYGGGSIYGYTNFPGRITHDLADPTATGYVPRDTLTDVLSMRAKSKLALHYGPWALYVAQAWDEVLDDDLNAESANSSNITLRNRLRDIEGIQDVITLDYLSGYDMVLVQLSPDVAREVVGMDITTLQWPTEGGMVQNFKVMCILVPQIRGDFNGNTGIVHGTVEGEDDRPTGEILVSTTNP